MFIVCVGFVFGWLGLLRFVLVTVVCWMFCWDLLYCGVVLVVDCADCFVV